MVNDPSLAQQGCIQSQVHSSEGEAALAVPKKNFLLPNCVATAAHSARQQGSAQKPQSTQQAEGTAGQKPEVLLQ